MAIKRYKPTSAARRFMTVHTYEEITETKPEKSLVEDMRKSVDDLPPNGRSHDRRA